MRPASVIPALLLLIAAAPTTQPARTENPQVALERRIPSAALRSVSLTDAIDALRDLSGANIHVNWRALALLNITRQTPVSVQVRQVSLRKMLQLLLDDALPGQLTFYVDDGVIDVTTKQLADAQLITKVYPVGDIVMDVPDFTAPGVNLSNSAGGSGRVSSSGSSPFSSAANNETAQQQQPRSKDQRGEDLVTLIKQTVSPDLWRDAGGTASIRQFNGMLIVTAPRSVHEALSTRR